MIAAKAEAIRRQAVLAVAGSGDWSQPATIAWPDDIPDTTRAREDNVFKSDLQEQFAKLADERFLHLLPWNRLTSGKSFVAEDRGLRRLLTRDTVINFLLLLNGAAPHAAGNAG